jgi:hypothetical protein
MFVYHEAKNALGWLDLKSGNGHLIATVATLRANGWIVSDGALRKALPRADKPIIVTPRGGTR